MSTTSTATTLAACNHIPGNEVELLNYMCVLVLTRGDSNSIWCCLHTGGEHHRDLHSVRTDKTKGVLQYSVAELVVLFHSADEMLVVACGVIKAMALCEEPIRFRMSPPSATHVRAFIVVRDAEPSGAQPPTPDRGRYLHHPPITPTQVGGPHVNCRWTLWPWGCQAMAVHGGPPLGGSSQGAKHTSQGPTTDPLGKSSGKQESWCGWPGGHLSERERVGTQRTTTFTSYPHSTRWRHRTSYKYNGHQSMTWHPSY